MQRSLIAFLLSCLPVALAFAESLVPSPTTRVVILGSGTPNPDPERAGPAVAIVVNDTPYLVDFGPGVVRRAAAMSPSYGGSIEGLETEKLAIAFLTHLHSDHTMGLPDLLLTPWIMGRERPLELYGPEGVASMAANIVAAYTADIRYRIDGLEPANETGWKVNAHEIDEGIVHSDDNVRVEALRVRHGSWKNAFAYRFETPDRVIVISGDVAPDPRLAEFAHGADILIHEVYSVSGFARRNEAWQQYHAAHHSSAHELGELATKVRPGLLVLYHVLFWGSTAETVLEEVREKYAGEVVLASDLDVF